MEGRRARRARRMAQEGPQAGDGVGEGGAERRGGVLAAGRGEALQARVRQMRRVGGERSHHARGGGGELVQREQDVPERTEEAADARRVERRRRVRRHPPEGLRRHTLDVVIRVRQRVAERVARARQQLRQQVDAHGEHILEAQHSGVPQLPKRLPPHQQQPIRHLRRRRREHRTEQHRERLCRRLAYGRGHLVAGLPVAESVEGEHADEPDGAVLPPLRAQAVAHLLAHRAKRPRRGGMRLEDGPEPQGGAVPPLPARIEERAAQLGAQRLKGPLSRRLPALSGERLVSAARVLWRVDRLRRAAARRCDDVAATLGTGALRSAVLLQGIDGAARRADRDHPAARPLRRLLRLALDGVARAL